MRRSFSERLASKMSGDPDTIVRLSGTPALNHPRIGRSILVRKLKWVRLDELVDSSQQAKCVNCSESTVL